VLRGTVGGDEFRAAILRNDERVAAIREHLYATALTPEQAAQLVGVTPDQVTRLLRDGSLLALDGPDVRLPNWQFHPESRLGWLEGIAHVAGVFPGGVLSLSSWMVAPNPDLGGSTPCQTLLAGDAEQVAAVAAVHGA